MNKFHKNLNRFHIITDLAGRFVKITYNEIDEEINNMLKVIGESIDLDSCYIYLYTEDLNFFEGEYKWNKKEYNIESLAGSSTEPYRWSIEELKTLKPIVITSIDEIPDKAEGENKFWHRSGIRSSLVIPVSSHKKLTGCIACRTRETERQWNEEDIELLTLTGEIIAGVFERKKIEEELCNYKNNLEDIIKKEKEERVKTENILSGSFNAINDLISVIDRDLKIVMSNWKGFEYLPEEIKQSKPHCYEIFMKSVNPCKNCPVKKRFETNYMEESEYIKIINGRTMEIRLFSIREDNIITMIVQTMRDITEKKKLEEESLILWRAIENTEESIIITDKERTIQYVNPAFEHITGYRRAEVIRKKSDFLLYPGKEGDSSYDTVINTIKSGHVWRGFIKDAKKNGVIYERESSISPVTDSKGHITGYISLSRDVTEKTKLEQQLRQSQKMESIGTLAGGIAHDFNNILGAIIINAETAIEDIPEDSAVKKNLEQILLSSNRAAELIKQILTFSHQHKEERKPVEISIIVKEVINLLRSSIPSTVHIKQAIRAKSSLVLSEPTGIHQIVMNLCTNAYHSMKEKGGIMEVTLEDIEIDSKDIPVHEHMAPGPYVKLSVSDTGCGIEDSVKERIFEPYFTTKKSGEGTGLGLSVIHGIVKNYGGIIKLYSEAGKGSTFHVYLPKIETGEIKKITRSAALPKGTETILFVDDEKAIAMGVKEILEKLGYRVFMTTDSLEALEIFKSDPHKFHLVITDQTMPGMTGSKLAKEIMSIRPDMPVILCTGFSEIITYDEAKAIGIKEFLMKPVKINNISTVIRNILDKNE